MSELHKSEGRNRPMAGAALPQEVIFGRSEVMEAVRKRVEKVAAANVPILIQGDGGTGKEVIARWIHAHSASSAGDFVKVNCAAIPGTLLETELFGYEKGAFTGALTSKPGRVELAHNGTLFLDEIADLDLGLQSKLLHFLQDGYFTRIGDSAERSVNTRLVCTSHRDLSKETEAGRFRADLFYRINVIQVNMPKLRERKEDIPILAEYFRAQYMMQFEKDCEPIGSEMLGYLQNIEWPGNVRELSNRIARYVLIGTEAMLTREPSRPGATAASLPSARGGSVPLKQIAKEAVRERERNLILTALKDNHWNRRKAAEALEISYRSLSYKIREAGISLRRVTGQAQRGGARTPTSPMD
jgi:two-component system, NtrC family, response regulator AtoC